MARLRRSPIPSFRFGRQSNVHFIFCCCCYCCRLSCCCCFFFSVSSSWHIYYVIEIGNMCIYYKASLLEAMCRGRKERNGTFIYFFRLCWLDLDGHTQTHAAFSIALAHEQTLENPNPKSLCMQCVVFRTPVRSASLHWTKLIPIILCLTCVIIPASLAALTPAVYCDESHTPDRTLLFYPCYTFIACSVLFL